MKPKENNYSARSRVLCVLKILVFTLIRLPASLACVPVFFIGVSIWGLPPIIPSCSRFIQYLTAAWVEGKPTDHVSLMDRLTVFLLVVDLLVKAPINGVFWYIDEVFYYSYNKTNIDKTLYFISGARSGSTQLVNYLEEDYQHFIAPTVLEGVYPFMWLWTLMSALSKCGFPIENIVRRKMTNSKERLKRDNFDPYRTKTWEVQFWTWQMQNYSPILGASFALQEYDSSLPARLDYQKELSHKLLQYTESCMKKVMYYRGKPGQCILIKGHFLSIANVLEKRYPRAYFLTCVRHPTSRLASHINFKRIIFSDFGRKYGFSPPSWKALTDFSMSRLLLYSKYEMEFFSQASTERKLAISFTNYVKDLSSVLKQVYSLCDITMIPVEVMTRATVVQKTSHDRTERRKGYADNFNKSIDDLGVDKALLEQELADYITWMNTL